MNQGCFFSGAALFFDSCYGLILFMFAMEDFIILSSPYVRISGTR